MKAADTFLLVSSILVAIPTVRAAFRILSARFKTAIASRKDAKLSTLRGQQRQTEALMIERLRNEAHDLIEFSTLVPSWALWFAMVGIGINILVRLNAVLSP